MSTLTATQLQQQYIAYFGRPGDPSGIKYWLSSSSGITTAREFADKIYAQEEYKSSTVGSKSIEEQVNSLYLNLFGRDADAKGLLYWTGEIEKGTLQLSNVAFDLIAAANNPLSDNATQGALDAKALSNKVDAATAYTAEIEGSTTAILAYQPSSQDPWKTSSAYTTAQNYLSTITDSVESTASAITTSVAAMTASTAGSATNKITLTNNLNDITGGVDDVLGTTGTDLIIGSVAAANPTYSLIDSIDGGAGTDTLNLSLAANADAVTVTNVENIQLRVSANATFDASDVTGATSIESKNSSADLTVSNAPLSATYSVTNAGDNDTFIGFRTADVEGTADTVSYTLNNVASTGGANGLLYTDNVETISVTTTGTKSKLGALASDNDGAAGTVTGASTVATLNVAGDVELTVTTALDVSVTTIDASAMTAGGVNLSITAGDDVTVTGSDGDDEFSFLGATNLTKKDTVDGGAGDDRLIVDENDLASTQWALVSNFEAIEAQVTGDNVAAAVDASLSGVTTLYADLEDNDEQAGGLIAATFSNVTDTQVLEVLEAKGDFGSIIDASNAVDITVTHATDDTTNAFTVNLAGIGNYNTAHVSNNVYGIRTLTVDNAETLTIGANKNSKATVTKNLITSLVSADATTINVTGDAQLNIDAITAAAVTLFDASTTTNKLDVTFDSAKTRTMNFGSADDTVVVGNTNAKVTVDLGDGDDKITMQGDNITADDSIDGGEGTDTLIVNADWTINSLANAATIVGLKNLEKVSMGNDDDIVINDAFIGSFTDSAVTITRENGNNANLVTASGVLNAGNTITVTGASQTGTGALNYVGSNGKDVYTGTKNVDNVTMTNLTVTGTDTIKGGDGADVFELDIDGSTATASVNVDTATQMSGVSSFSTFRVSDSTNNDKVGIVLDDAFVSANESASALSILGLDNDGTTASNDNLTFDASGVTHTHIALTLTGGADEDTIKGGAGKDEIDGGAAADKLTGGAGKDDFNFGTNATADTLVDFDFGTSATTGTVDQMDLIGMVAGTGITTAWSMTPGTFDVITKFSAGTAAFTVGVDVVIMDTTTYATVALADAAMYSLASASVVDDVIMVWADTFNTVHFAVSDARGTTATVSADYATLTSHSIAEVADVLSVDDFIIG